MDQQLVNSMAAACKINLPLQQAFPDASWSSVTRPLPMFSASVDPAFALWCISAAVMNRFTADESIGMQVSMRERSELWALAIDGDKTLGQHIEDAPVERAPYDFDNRAPLVHYSIGSLAKQTIEASSLALAILVEDNLKNITFRFQPTVLPQPIVESMADAIALIVRNLDALADIPLKLLPLIDSKGALGIQVNGAFAADDPIRMLGAFEEQVKRNPEAIALVFEGDALTYQELNARANRVGRALRRMGVKPDDVIALCTERSLEMLIALYGIFKAGAGYMPIECELPLDRVHSMVEDAQPRLLLTHVNQSERMKGLGLKTVVLDRDMSFAKDEAEDDFEPMTLAGHLGYLLFTSGSTGKPKGVCYPLSGCLNRIEWMQRTYNLGSKDALLQKTPYGFDVSFWELFWPLAVGARIVICKPNGHADTAYLIHTLRSQSISIVHFVPSMLNAFLHDVRKEDCPSLRWIIASGEALTPRLEALCEERLSGVLHNQYGPTESGECSYWESSGQRSYRSTPIGEALSGFEMAVLDSNLGKLPLGAVGELYIAGQIGLARGYLNRPGLTAERFQPDVITGEAGGRMYKTGDLAREIRSGVFEYLGRIDHQVKVRGFRIDVTEIEWQLDRHPGVQEARVFAVDFGDYDKRLVAYVIPKGHESLPELSLREHVRAKLPAYMEPSMFIAVSSFPVTTNGKIDFKSLPKPSQAQPIPSGDYSSDIQVILAELWREALGAEPLDIDQDFFAAGGDSLRAIRFVQSIQETFELRVSLMAFHEARSVRTLEQLLETILEGQDP
jgi:amino acid adenylation domain-containing protein